MVLYGELSSDVLTFGHPLIRRRLGVLLTCLGATLVMLACFLPEASRRLMWAIAGGGALIVVVGFLLISWGETLRLELRGNHFDYRRGLPRLGRHLQGPLDVFERLTLLLSRETNLYGEEEVCGAVRLEGQSASVMLASHLAEKDARSLAERIARAMGRMVEERPAEESKGRLQYVLHKSAAWSVWAGMAAVFSMVAWTATHSSVRTHLGNPFTINQRQSSYDAYRAGTNLYQIGDFKGAERELKRAVKETPQYPEAYNELTYALADQNKLDEAMETARKALSQSPNSGDILDTVAEMHQRRGEFSKAANYYEQALKHDLTQGSCQTNAKYGETLIALGRKDEAIWHLEAAIADTNGFNRVWQVRAARALSELTHQPMKPLPRIRSGGFGLNEHPMLPPN